MTSFRDLRVVEIAGTAAGGYAGRLFAGWGASVTLIGASADRDPDLSRFLDSAKWQHPRLDADAEQLIDAADVVIESAGPDPLEPATAERPGLVRVEISPFGSTGPYRRRRSTELTDQAVAGHLFLNGDPGREPVAGPVNQVLYASGLHGFIGAVAAVFGGRSGTVETSHHEVMTSLHQFTLLRWLNTGDVLGRMGNRFAGPGRACGLYRCRDGYVSLIIPRDDQLERALAVTDGYHLLSEPGIEETYDLMHHPTLLEDHLEAWFLTKTAAEAITILQEVRVPAGPSQTIEEVLTDEHLRSRDFWVTVGGVEQPGPPTRIDGMGWRTTPTPPTPDRDRTPPGGTATAADAATAALPLSGVRVIDLTRVWAGPLAARMLGDLGADVIMVEAPWNRGGSTIDASSIEATRYYPDDDPGDDHWNRIGFVNKYATGKRAVALDLAKPGGLDVLERLLVGADLVIENFSPRVMPQLGLDETRLAELNPGLVYVAMPGYGRTGPDADNVAYGPIIDSHAGLSAVMGYPDETARKGGIAWPDPVAGMHGAAGALVALLAAGSDDEPVQRTVEVAQIEACVNMIGHAVVAAGGAPADGRVRTGPGSRDHRFVPQGVYRCSGDDRWVALSLVDDDDWPALAELIDAGRLGDLGRAERQARHDEIDALITRWTSRLEVDAAVSMLSDVGLAAAVVAEASEVMADPQLADREAFFTVEHPSAGPETWPHTPIRFVGSARPTPRPAGRLGEHNREIVVDELGLTVDEYEALVSAEVLADRPPD